MKSQIPLVKKILKKLSAKKILDQVLIIGSWCAYFYQDYFKGVDYRPALKTRDIDFVLPPKPNFSQNIDLENLLAEEGFEIEFFGSGFMKLENDQLQIEFLIPETGPSKDKPYPLPQLKLNAQRLRHLNMLWRDPIKVLVDGIPIKLPHPADLICNKLVVSEKRKKAEKRPKDLATALAVLQALIQFEGLKNLAKAIDALSTNEKKIVVKKLKILLPEKLQKQLPFYKHA